MLCLWFWWLKLVSGSRYSRYGHLTARWISSRTFLRHFKCLITINTVFWLALLFIVDLHCSWPLHWYLFVHLNTCVPFFFYHIISLCYSTAIFDQGDAKNQQLFSNYHLPHPHTFRPPTTNTKIMSSGHTVLFIVCNTICFLSSFRRALKWPSQHPTS